MPDLPLFLLLLLILAAILRNDLIFYVFYLFAGLYILGTWWARRGLPALRLVRRHDDRLFLGERRMVELEITNTSRLPLVWVRLAERLPPQLYTPAHVRAVVSLSGGGRTHLRYELLATRRGYYELGPLQLSTGDLLGMSRAMVMEFPAAPVIVYPKVIPLGVPVLPSRTPFGRLPHAQRLFEDPTRLIGTRGYQPGDSWRLINWKASAAVGSLQTKQLEPAISLETMLVLNLNEPEYDTATWSVASELGVTTAASLAHAIVEAGQSAGLLAYGRDPLATDGRPPPPVPPHPGRPHLMLLLEQLARIEIASLPIPFAERLREAGHEAPWGATFVVITPDATDEVLAAGYTLRRAGFPVTLALTALRSAPKEARARAAAFGLAAVVLDDEESLTRWPNG